MTLDDVYGSDRETFPLEQEAADWPETVSLEWDDSAPRAWRRLLREAPDSTERFAN